MDYSYSFPLIYFNVEDYESTWSDLVISDSLHYCVRLFVIVRLGPLRSLPAKFGTSYHQRRLASNGGAFQSLPAPSAGMTSAACSRVA